MAKGSKKLQAALNSAKNARKRAKKSKDNFKEKAGALAAGAGVGWLAKSGNLDRLPTFGGNVPPELGLAAIALAGEMYTRPGSNMHAGFKGAANGLLFSVAREYVETGSVSGYARGVSGFIPDNVGVSGIDEVMYVDDGAGAMQF